jgi:hypothetical protein
MSTATIQYVVSTAIPAQSEARNNKTPAVLNIAYTDANGVEQSLINYNSPSGSWSLTFTGTVGNMYHLNAKDIQNFSIVTCTVYENGSSVATANNASNVNIKAGVAGTI